jgi:hypothetical protein
LLDLSASAKDILLWRWNGNSMKVRRRTEFTLCSKARLQTADPFPQFFEKPRVRLYGGGSYSPGRPSDSSPNDAARYTSRRIAS